jgi:CBS domain-containing membrane protein
MIRKQVKRTYRIFKYVIYKETIIDYKEKLWSFLGSFLGIGMIAFIQSIFITKNDNLFLIGSFGASSVLIYGVIQSPLAQPRNLIGGQIVSAIIGVTVCRFLPDIIWLTAPLALLFSMIHKEPIIRRFDA